MIDHVYSFKSVSDEFNQTIYKIHRYAYYQKSTVAKKYLFSYLDNFV